MTEQELLLDLKRVRTKMASPKPFNLKSMLSTLQTKVMVGRGQTLSIPGLLEGANKTLDFHDLKVPYNKTTERLGVAGGRIRVYSRYFGEGSSPYADEGEGNWPFGVEKRSRGRYVVHPSNVRLWIRWDTDGFYRSAVGVARPSELDEELDL